MKRIICIFTAFLLVFCFSACSSSQESENNPFTAYAKWKTEPDMDGIYTRWEFYSKEFTQYVVIGGEDTFTETFTYTYKDSKLVCKSDYATLTYEVTVDGNVLTAKTETGETIVFKGE